MSRSPQNSTARARNAALSIAAAVAALAGAGQASALTLTVQVQGLQSHSGVLRACLWNSGVGFPDCEHKPSVARISGPAEEGTALRFENIPPGEYAVSITQDLDSDGHMRKNFIGMPKEPVGVSNNPSLVKIPPPGWKDAKVAVPGDMTISIKLVNFK